MLDVAPGCGTGQFIELFVEQVERRLVELFAVHDRLPSLQCARILLELGERLL